MIGALNSKTLGFLKIDWISYSASILDCKSFIIGSSSSFQRPSSSCWLNLSWKKSLTFEDYFSFPLPLLLPIEIGLFLELNLQFAPFFIFIELRTLWQCHDPYRFTYLCLDGLLYSLLVSDEQFTS